MIALIQRVHHASVSINNTVVGEINTGLLIFLGVEKKDNEQSATQLCQRILTYRVFGDHDGKMNLNIQQIGGSLLVVSQFTLVADTKKGTRPSFSNGALPTEANRLYDYFVTQCKNKGVPTETGQFAADMQVSLVNDGPVTFLLNN